MKRLIGVSLGVIALALFWSAVARADVSPAVQKKFKGQILVSADAFPTSAADDAELIRQLKKAHTAVVTSAKGEGGAVWRFYFMAFMSHKPGATQVALDFYTEDKKKEFVAQKRLAGIDPTLTLLESQVELSEDDGLSPDRDYLVKLTTEVKGKDVILATVKLRTK
jgi:hypothetical protein